MEIWSLSMHWSSSLRHLLSRVVTLSNAVSCTLASHIGRAKEKVLDLGVTFRSYVHSSDILFRVSGTVLKLSLSFSYSFCCLWIASSSLLCSQEMPDFRRHLHHYHHRLGRSCLYLFHASATRVVPRRQTQNTCTQFWHFGSQREA